MDLEKVIDVLTMQVAKLTKENAILRVSLQEEKDKHETEEKSDN